MLGSISEKIKNQLNPVATLRGNLEIPGILNKKPGILPILPCSIIKFRFDTKKLQYKSFFLTSSEIFLLKNTYKVNLQYLFNVVVLFITVSYIKLNFKLKINPKMCTFKNLEFFFITKK